MSIVATTSTFGSPQWSLIMDLVVRKLPCRVAMLVLTWFISRTKGDRSDDLNLGYQVNSGFSAPTHLQR
jgi:hypothetical protein